MTAGIGALGPAGATGAGPGDDDAALAGVGAAGSSYSGGGPFGGRGPLGPHAVSA